jgi:hypothetical protein
MLSTAPPYGWIRLPETLADGLPADGPHNTYYFDFLWRSNGVVPAGMSLDEQKPDLISAYYRTAAVLDINLTVTRADPAAATQPGLVSQWLGVQAVGQSAHMSRRVKLQNLLRRVQYAED